VWLGQQLGLSRRQELQELVLVHCRQRVAEVYQRLDLLVELVLGWLVLLEAYFYPLPLCLPFLLYHTISHLHKS
jgi:hypothetical protein